MNKQKNNTIKHIEEALLGLILSSKKFNESLIQVFIFLDESNFTTKETKLMFNILKHFSNLPEKKIDIKLICSYINSNNLEKEITLKYINYLMINSGFLSSLNQYLDQIRENTAKLKLANVLETNLKNIDSIKPDAMIDDIRNHLYKIEERKINKDFKKGKEVANHVVEEIFKINKEIKGIKTGFKSLDEITSGLQKGDLVILAARPSVGKTAFALNLAANIMTMQNKNIAFFSLEMPAEQLIQRMLSTISYVDNYKFKHNQNLTEYDKNKILEAVDKLNKINFFIDDSGSIRLDEIIWKSRKQKEMNKLDLIIIDYLQLIPTNSYGDNRQQEVSKISRSLKQLARELEVPIIALSQLNRRVETREDKKPMMSDLRESGAIEQDADIIGFLYREDYYLKEKKENDVKVQITELNIAKHRNGAIGTIELLFNPSIGKFSEYSNKIDDVN